MRSSTIALALISSVVAVDFFGVDLSAGCVDYIKKSDPIVAKVGPQFLALEEAGRGSSVEQPAAEANAAVQSALKLYNAQKDGTLNQAVSFNPHPKRFARLLICQDLGTGQARSSERSEED